MSYINLAGEMENFKKHIEDERDMYTALRDEVRGILGDTDYLGIYRYFSRLLCDAEYDFLIIMSRRCLVLSQIFIVFLILDECSLDEKLVIMSDKAIPYYKDELKEKSKIGVADDILIHGRTISKMCGLLNAINANMKIHVYGYKKDIDLKNICEEYKVTTTVCSAAYKSEWRNLSNKLVRCIYASNVPYTSFVTSFFQYNENVMDKIKTFDLIKRIDNTEGVQRSEGLKSWYCYEPEGVGQFPIFEKILLAKGIRLYWSEKINKSTIIPYAFIKRMNVADANKLFESVSSNMPDGYDAIKQVLKRVSEDAEINDALLSYKMRLMTCLLSRLYWLDFVNRYALNEIYSIDVDTMEKSFGQDVTKELICMKVDEMTKVLELVPNISVVSEKNEECLQKFLAECKKDIRPEERKIDGIKRYFHKAWYEDERRAAKYEQRRQGISVDYCLETFEGNIGERQEVLADLVNIWDTGIAAANYAVNQTGDYVACYNTAGEQSYRVIIEKYPFIFFSLIAVSKLIRKSDAKKSESFEKCRKRILNELLAEFHRNQKINDYVDIKNIIDIEEGYMNAWNQVEIMGDDLLESCEQKELVMNFINRKF